MPKTIIPCGGWYIDGTTLTFDENKVLSATGGAGGNFLPLAGGTMDAGAIIEGTDEIQIAVGDDSAESGVIGVTQSGVTIEHNTNSNLDANIRVIENTVEIAAETTTITINGTGVNMGGAAISNVASIGGNSAEVAFENDMDMNNHKITGLANPTENTDAVNLQYLTGLAATTTTAGIVKQAESVADGEGWTDTTAQSAFNSLLTALRNAGILSE